jgi:hypothetical protein
MHQDFPNMVGDVCKTANSQPKFHVDLEDNSTMIKHFYWEFYIVICKRFHSCCECSISKLQSTNVIVSVGGFVAGGERVMSS